MMLLWENRFGDKNIFLQFWFLFYSFLLNVVVENAFSVSALIASINQLLFFVKFTTLNRRCWPLPILSLAMNFVVRPPIETLACDE